MAYKYGEFRFLADTKQLYLSLEENLEPKEAKETPKTTARKSEFREGSATALTQTPG